MKLSSIALAEVYEVLISLKPIEYNKIPKNIIINIRDNRDKNYEKDFENLQNGQMSKDASKILAAIYLKYLANNDERNIVKEIIVNKNIKNSNILIRDNIFDNKSKIPSTYKNEILVVEKSFFKKILDKIKSFFMKGV